MTIWHKRLIKTGFGYVSTLLKSPRSAKDRSPA
jgi:hypothetical protein